MALKENYIITIDGTQIVDGNEDLIQLTTLGDYSIDKDRCSTITYCESSATGYPGNVTTLRAEDGRRVMMTRIGANNAELVIEAGRRHLCHYNTDFGALMIGVRAQSIENKLDEHGGSLRFRYCLDVNSNELSTNELNITVREKQAHV